ncbi:MAG: UTP--glucose-1-phosphate uridylyltransferase [Planctomycetota bacterium]|jgi:UDP-N-acetylglucosamine/UDP-N-acetylgalactosamine diphosphorylase
MTAQRSFERVKKTLKNHNQGHILAFWGQLTVSQQENLLAQIEDLDFSKVDNWTACLVKEGLSADIAAEIEPAPFYPVAPANAQQEHKYLIAKDLGEKMIRQGRVAAFLVAGGQGTRLGIDGPKGDFPVSPVKNKTLFRIFSETIRAVSEKYTTFCPWYIMTSSLNDSETREIFRMNDYYGLDKENVFIFQQGTLPNFTLDGKILLADKANIACSPDGHGGSLKALCRSGAVEDMKKHGIEYISYFQVDNPLVNIFDPLFIGLHALDKSEMSSKALIKKGPFEKVGNFCLVDGKVAVIEYSDLPDNIAEKTDPDNSLVFQLGSIAIHIISTSFVEKLNFKGFSLPLHKAVKKISHIDSKGNFIEPDKPNGVKLESFVFDALSLASKSIILETLRSEEFAPVKNATGDDSPEVTKKIMIERAAAWLESAGISVPKKPDGSPDCAIEIAPSFAVKKEDIRTKLDKIPPIKPDSKIYLA